MATARVAYTTVAARNDFSEVVNRAAFGRERIILSRRGKAVAAVVPIADVDLLQVLEDDKDLRAAVAARAEAKKKGTIRLEDLRHKLDV